MKRFVKAVIVPVEVLDDEKALNALDRLWFAAVYKEGYAAASESPLPKTASGFSPMTKHDAWRAHQVDLDKFRIVKIEGDIHEKAVRGVRRSARQAGAGGADIGPPGAALQHPMARDYRQGDGT